MAQLAKVLAWKPHRPAFIHSTHMVEGANRLLGVVLLARTQVIKTKSSLDGPMSTKQFEVAVSDRETRRGGVCLSCRHSEGKGQKRLWEFEASLVYVASARTARNIERESQNNKFKKNFVSVCLCHNITEKSQL